MLDALYEAGRDRRLLTFAAYRALGGLEGAIARRADEVVDALPPEIQEALPAVLRGLTTVRLGDETVTARPASLADVAGSPGTIGSCRCADRGPAPRQRRGCRRAMLSSAWRTRRC